MRLLADHARLGMKKCFALKDFFGDFYLVKVVLGQSEFGSAVHVLGGVDDGREVYEFLLSMRVNHTHHQHITHGHKKHSRKG